MHTPEQVAEFHAAYEEWTKLREIHEAEMLAIVRGEKTADTARLVAQAQRVVDAHARFTKAGEVFIGMGRLSRG